MHYVAIIYIVGWYFHYTAFKTLDNVSRSFQSTSFHISFAFLSQRGRRRTLSCSFIFLSLVKRKKSKKIKYSERRHPSLSFDRYCTLVFKYQWTRIQLSARCLCIQWNFMSFLKENVVCFHLSFSFCLSSPFTLHCRKVCICLQRFPFSLDFSYIIHFLFLFLLLKYVKIIL